MFCVSAKGALVFHCRLLNGQSGTSLNAISCYRLAFFYICQKKIMVLENKRFIGKIKLARFVLIIVFSVSVVVLHQLRFLDQYSFGYTRWLYIALVTGLYIAVSVYRYFRAYSYIYYSDDKSQLEIRYYHSVLFGRNYSVVRIPFGELAKYELRENFLRRSLVLYQKNRNGQISKYSGIPFTAVDKEDLKLILANIDSYIKK